MLDKLQYLSAYETDTFLNKSCGTDGPVSSTPVELMGSYQVK